MNPAPLFLIIVTLPLLLGGCVEKHDGVNTEGVELRDGIAYLRGSDTPYTGKIYGLYKNGRKLAEGNYKDGKQEGLTVEWHENGLKKAEANFNDGKQEGLAVEWHENGLKKAEGNWKDGKQEGLAVKWHENGLKAVENNWKYSKQEGLAVGWHENGLKAGESDWKDGKKISSKYWNNKGEPVDTYKEAIK